MVMARWQRKSSGGKSVSNVPSIGPHRGPKAVVRHLELVATVVGRYQLHNIRQEAVGHLNLVFCQVVVPSCFDGARGANLEK